MEEHVMRLAKPRRKGLLYLIFSRLFIIVLLLLLQLSLMVSVYAWLRDLLPHFALGEAMFAYMLEELKKAEKFIFLECFIVEEGYMWGSLLKILADKAAAGVEDSDGFVIPYGDCT